MLFNQVTLERVMAGLLLALLSPIFFAVWLLVKLSSKGPGFYFQTRVGKNQKTFEIIKFRTMHHNCELKSGPQWSQKGDARITKVGNFLRVTHLDELPQLINVIKGEMRFIGPRPERPEFVTILENHVERYHERHEVLPGITGLAQVQLPADSKVVGVRKKVSLDLWYIETQSVMLDLVIVLCTVFKSTGFGLPFSRKLLAAYNGGQMLRKINIAGKSKAAAQPLIRKTA